MGRQRNPNRDKAFELYQTHNGKLSSVEIATKLGEKVGTINNWRTQDKWKDKVGKAGAPYGNQNAVGNSGGGAPLMNQNSYLHGFYSKYLPKQTYDIMKDIANLNPLDMLWQNILMKFAAIVRSQKIMFVKNKKEKMALEKQAAFISVQSKAMGQLSNMIKRYDEMLHKNWDLATEEQKLRIEVLKQRLKDPDQDKNKLEDFM